MINCPLLLNTFPCWPIINLSIKNEYDSIVDAANSPSQKHTESTPVKVVGPVNYNASSDSGVVSLGMLIYNLILTHTAQSDLIMALIIRTFTQTLASSILVNFIRS